MSAPTLATASGWRPDALAALADGWDTTAARVEELLASIVAACSGGDPSAGAAAEAARRRAVEVAADGQALLRATTLAAVAARDGAGQLARALADVVAVVGSARADGFVVADDGTVSPGAAAAPLLVALSGGDPSIARGLMVRRAAELTQAITAALDRLGAADADAARDLEEAVESSGAPGRAPAATDPAASAPVSSADLVAGWPGLPQHRIAAQIAAMTPGQRRTLVDEFPQQVGNTDGIPWDMRIAANRINIAQAVVAEDGADPASRRRIELYRGLLAEIDDPARTGARVDRQILAFDPARASLVELTGSLATARSVAVLVPGLNTTVEGSAGTTQTARRFVSATRGDVAMITYLGGPFPRGNPLTGLVAAADPRYALDMAPRLVSFSHDVDRVVDATGRSVPVTYVGHSYGGSIVGTAEALGLTGDRILYVAAAGAGVGVEHPDEWHNRNPDVLRFSMTAPGDPIEAVQGIPGGPHGADPDEMPGVIRLDAGRYDDGRPMAGPAAHSDVLNWPSDAWRNVLAVITGDSESLHGPRVRPSRVGG
ncbi:alpha/beta hydrolase [Mycobacterium sp. NPDC050551]|uniref:alpha/beta hydrolase n=1 Tax=Mycobacterium sp. NPDC050551 TaxID=3155407 RepID=UPI0034314199